MVSQAQLGWLLPGAKIQNQTSANWHTQPEINRIYLQAIKCFSTAASAALLLQCSGVGGCKRLAQIFCNSPWVKLSPLANQSPEVLSDKKMLTATSSPSRLPSFSASKISYQTWEKITEEQLKMAYSWHLSSVNSLYLSKPVQLQTKAVCPPHAYRKRGLCTPSRWAENSLKEKPTIFSVVSNTGKLSNSMGCIAAQPFLMAQGGEAAVRTCSQGRGGGRDFCNHGRSCWRSLIRLSQTVTVF